MWLFFYTCRWSAIAAKLPGRTDNEIKNYWNTHIRKRLLRMGIDPVTHTPRLDLLDLPSLLNNHYSDLLHNYSSNHQLNLLKLLGNLQSLVNPNLLGLASLLSTTQAQNFGLLQNLQSNQLFSTNPSPIIQNPIQNCSQMVNNSNTTNFCNTQVIKSSLDTYPANFTNFDSENTIKNCLDCNDHLAINNTCMLNNEATSECVQNSDNYQVILDSLLETLGLNSSNNDVELKMPSLLSTPCSSQHTPTPPLSASNSAFNPPNNSSTSSGEDEIDSYCKILMNFDVPFEFLDNNSC